MSKTFNFIGFAPSDNLVRYANTFLSLTMEITPSESTCEAIMKFENGSYVASIKIFSSEGTFGSTSNSKTPEMAIDILDELIKAQLTQWLSTRFVTGSSKNI